jgi:hypothetical protein
LSSLCKTNDLTDEQTEPVVPFVGSVAVVITLANISSFIGYRPAKIGALFWAFILSVLFVVYSGFRFVGPKGMWKSLLHCRHGGSFPHSRLCDPIQFLRPVVRQRVRRLHLMDCTILSRGLPGVLGLWLIGGRDSTGGDFHLSDVITLEKF